MVCLLLCIALAVPAAAPPPTPPTPPAEGKRRVLVLDFKGENVDTGTTRTLTEIVANAFARDTSLAVMSGADVRAVLDVEASKATLDCKEATSCLAEVAGALGAELVVSGSVGKLGELLVVTFTVYDAKEQTTAAKQKVEDRNLEQLSPKLDEAVATILRGDAGPVAGQSGGSGLFLGGVVAAAGGGIIAVGGALAAVYGFTVQEDKTSSGADKETAALVYPLGLIGVGVGTTAAIAGGVMMGMGAE